MALTLPISLPEGMGALPECGSVALFCLALALLRFRPPRTRVSLGQLGVEALESHDPYTQSAGLGVLFFNHWSEHNKRLWNQVEPYSNTS